MVEIFSWLSGKVRESQESCESKVSFLDFKFLIKVAVRGVVTQILMIHGCILIHSPNKAEERQKLQAEIELLTTKLRDLDQKMAMASEGAVGV